MKFPAVEKPSSGDVVGFCASEVCSGSPGWTAPEVAGASEMCSGWSKESDDQEFLRLGFSQVATKKKRGAVKQVCLRPSCLNTTFSQSFIIGCSSLRLESDSRQLNRFLTRIQTLTGITFKKVVKKLNFYTAPGYKGLVNLGNTEVFVSLEFLKFLFIFSCLVVLFCFVAVVIWLQLCKLTSQLIHFVHVANLNEHCMTCKLREANKIYSFKPSIMECKGTTVIGGYLEGQTIPNVGVYLPEPVFSHGQLYVALSRGISRGNTKVLVKSVEKSNVDEVYISNVVYKEVLSD
ncbi:hypothetical protein LXL04_001122 [Taraxacum kok-saghyz]